MGGHNTTGADGIDLQNCAAELQPFAYPAIFHKTICIGVENYIWAKAPYIEIAFSSRRGHGI